MRSRDRFCFIGLVVGLDQLDLIFLTADVDSREHLVGIADSIDLLQTAAAVFTGLRLKYANLDHISGSRIVSRR